MDRDVGIVGGRMGMNGDAKRRAEQHLAGWQSAAGRRPAWGRGQTLALAVGWLAIGGLVGWGRLPAVAQSASNFGTISLSPGDSPDPVRGYTQGSMPLAAIATQDGQGNLCVGFAESEPDHVLVLSEAIASLTLRVDSRGGDTTLLVQGPNDRTIQCSDDTGNSPDASLRGQNWQPGEYKIWVGAFDAGVRYDYTLTIQGAQ